MIIFGLYSPEPQSGKSTLTQMLSNYHQVGIYKVSGAMKAMCEALVAPFLEGENILSWIEGSQKDTIVPGMTQDDVARGIENMVSALFNSSGGQVLTDSLDQEISRSRLINDMKTVFLPNLMRNRENGITPRDVQKVLGLEFGRILYGDDFWLKPLRAQISVSEDEIVVIDDIRFEDDAYLVAELGGYLVRIERPGAKKPDAHQSEGRLEEFDFDANLKNDGTLEDFETLVKSKILPLI
jgi:hypothetical protein